VFIKIWKNLDGFKENAELFTWIYRIAMNESLTFLNKKSKREKGEKKDAAKRWVFISA